MNTSLTSKKRKYISTENNTIDEIIYYLQKVLINLVHLYAEDTYKQYETQLSSIELNKMGQTPNSHIFYNMNIYNASLVYSDTSDQFPFGECIAYNRGPIYTLVLSNGRSYFNKGRDFIPIINFETCKFFSFIRKMEFIILLI